MSVKVSNWVWYHCPEKIDGTAIRGNLFIVLLALADIADDEGKCIYGDRDKRKREALAKKTRMSVKTFYRTTDLLQQLELITITRVGLQNQYTVNMPSIEAATGQVDLLVTTGQVVQKGQDDPHYRSTVTDVRTFNVQTTIGPIQNPTTELDFESDDLDSVQLGWRGRRKLARTTGELDIEALAQLVGHVLTGHEGIAADGLHRILGLIARRILLRPALTNTHVERPTSYVAVAIRNEPDVWRKIAFELEANQ